MEKPQAMEKFYKFYRQFEALVYSIREADGFVVESLKNALEEFYKTEDEVINEWLKDNPRWKKGTYGWYQEDEDADASKMNIRDE